MRPRVWTAALFAACLAVTAHSSAGDEVPISPAAKQHFKAGIAFLEDPEGARYEEAYAAFKAAYKESPSPKILGNLGLSAMKLERDGEAVDAYTRYLAEVKDIAPNEKAQIERDLSTMRTALVEVRLKIEPQGVSVVDTRKPTRGSDVSNSYGPSGAGELVIGIRPGRHVFKFKAVGFQEEVWELEASPATKHQHTIALKKPGEGAPPPASTSAPPPPTTATGTGTTATPSGSKSVAPYVLMGVGGVAIVGGAVTGLMAKSKESSIKDKCPGADGACQPGYDPASDKSSAKSLATMTNVLIIGGAVLAGAGVTWMVLSKDDKKATASGVCTGQGCFTSVKVTF